MDKLKMQTANKADDNFKKLAAMFPNAVTETINENGEVARAIDKDVLMQEISCKVVDGNEERYQFTWPDKKKSVLLANAPINRTLRPVREDETVPTGADSEGKPYCSTGSVDFDTTENLYIEGDNLEVLKLLQETYLGKIKMIYIDPPYNTGNDFVYNDEFGIRSEEWNGISGNYDADGNQIVGALERNTEANGRFHTDWLNMMYPRLRLAKDLLADDGAIFVSIDEHEHENLIHIMNEVFGESNYIDSVVWDKKGSAKGVPPRNMMVNVHEYIVAYQKSEFKFVGEKRDAEADGFKNPDNDPRGPWRESNIKSTTKPIEQAFTIVDPNTGREYHNTWAFSKESLERMIRENRILWKDSLPKQKEFMNELTNENKAIKSNWGVFDAQSTTVYLKKLIPEVKFDNPKPINLMKYLVNVSVGKDDFVLDFFSGSGTTAHAVMQLNAEDGGHRKFIMVQLPEKCDEKSEAYKAGYKTICEIGKERIRRAGKKIREENTDNSSLLTPNSKLDTGFRVLKCDTSNMKDVYYNPSEYDVNIFSRLEDNIKADRTPEDLLFQVMLDLGILLSSKIQVRSVEVGMRSYSYFDVEDGYLIACFDENIDEEVITTIAKQKPYYFVMRDSSMASDSVATNFDQIFATYSPDTVRKVL